MKTKLYEVSIVIGGKEVVLVHVRGENEQDARIHAKKLIDVSVREIESQNTRLWGGKQ